MNIIGASSSEYISARNVAVLQLHMRARVAADNLQFFSVKHEVLMMNKVIIDSKTNQQLNVNCYKVPVILEKIFVPINKKRLGDIFRKQRFLMIIDESTDVLGIQSMNIYVRYRNPDFRRIQEPLWEVVEIHNDEYSTANAESFFNKMKATFDNENLIMTSILSFRSDTSNVMQGLIILLPRD